MFDLQGMTQKDWRLFCERGRRAQAAVDRVIATLAVSDTPSKPTNEGPSRPQERDGQ